MKEKTVGSIYKIQKLLDKFISERKWEKYHTPKNLAMSIAIESAELMEHFQWCNKKTEQFSKDEKDKIAEEMADVLHFLLRLSSVLNIDLYEASVKKIEKNIKRFPVDAIENIKKEGC